MAKRSRKIVCFSMCVMLICMNFLTVRAEALPEVMSGSTTLADNIMTYYALSGSAVANTDWINTLYSSYGSSFGTIEELANQGYLVLNDAGMWEPVQELGQMIEHAPAYSSLGLNEMFNVSAEEVAAGGGYAVASGGSILAGSLGGVASTGVLPLLGGVTAAYWGGIALGTLIAHGIGLYGRPVTNGIPITYNQALENLPLNASVLCNDDYVYYCTDGNLYCIACYESGKYFFRFLTSGNANVNQNVHSVYLQTGQDNIGWVIANNSNGRGGQTSNSSTTYITGLPNPHVYLGNRSALSSYVSAFKNNEVGLPIKYSPDMIGENGNLEGQPDNGGYTIPDMKPQIDPGTQAGKPLTLQDWQNFANGVQNNNNNSDPAGNKGLFDNILDLIRTVIPENVPNPNPNPNPDPWSPPVVTPVPDPSYPDPVPDQEITENPEESENPQQTENPIDTGKPWRLPDLRQKFPFCIPWDIAKIFSKLKVNVRQAPHMSWRFNPPNTPIDYTFNLDLEDYEEAAALLRTLELMGFIVGLAFATRYLIGAN